MCHSQSLNLVWTSSIPITVPRKTLFLICKPQLEWDQPIPIFLVPERLNWPCAVLHEALVVALWHLMAANILQRESAKLLLQALPVLWVQITFLHFAIAPFRAANSKVGN